MWDKKFKKKKNNNNSILHDKLQLLSTVKHETSEDDACTVCR